jgi:cytidylate kinase
MAVITISRQYGSGGSSIAQRVAERLGWTLIDNDFVDRVAQRAGLSPDEVAQQQERVPSLIERLAQALTVSSPEMFAAAADPSATLPPEQRLVKITETVIAEAVQQGDVVMVGRGAQAYLGEREGALHVYIAAPREHRIREAVRRLGVPEHEAAKTLDETDDGRRRYVKTHYGRRWDDAANYDLVLNSSRLGYDGCAELIIAAAKRAGLVTPPPPAPATA